MSREEGQAPEANQEILVIEMVYSLPSLTNDAQPGERHRLVALLGINASHLRGPEEIGMIAGKRIEVALAQLLEQLQASVTAYNEAHPVEEKPAAQEEDEVKLQA